MGLELPEELRKMKQDTAVHSPTPLPDGTLERWYGQTMGSEHYWVMVLCHGEKEAQEGAEFCGLQGLTDIEPPGAPTSIVARVSPPTWDWEWF